MSGFTVVPGLILAGRVGLTVYAHIRKRRLSQRHSETADDLPRRPPIGDYRGDAR